jgi:hypothetical protein
MTRPESPSRSAEGQDDRSGEGGRSREESRSGEGDEPRRRRRRRRSSREGSASAKGESRTDRREPGSRARRGDRGDRGDRRSRTSESRSSRERSPRADFSPVAGRYDEDDEGLEFLGVEDAVREGESRPRRGDEDDVLEESGLGSVLDVPSWVEAIGIVIAGNLAGRSKARGGRSGPSAS